MLKGRWKVIQTEININVNSISDFVYFNTKAMDIKTSVKINFIFIDFKPLALISSIIIVIIIIFESVDITKGQLEQHKHNTKYIFCCFQSSYNESYHSWKDSHFACC